MRAIDMERFIAMTEIKMRSNEIVWLSDIYKTNYLDETIPTHMKISILDDLWRQITESKVRLTEILRENGI